MLATIKIWFFQYIKGTLNMMVQMAIIFLVGAGIYWLVNISRDAFFDDRVSTPADKVAKQLPKGVKVKLKTGKSIEPSRGLTQITMSEKNNETTIVIDLTAQTGFGAMRSADRSLYRLVLYNTKLEKGFKRPVLSPSISQFKTERVEENLVVYFTLSPDVTVSQLAYEKELSDQLVIKLLTKKSSRHLKRFKYQSDSNAVDGIKQIKIKRSPSQKSDEAYQASLKAANRQDVEASILQAKKALSLRPDHHKARKIMILGHLKAGRLSVAKQVLAEGLKMEPKNIMFLQLKARILVQQNKLQQALSVLYKVQPDIKDNPDYYSFIAALYQQLEEYGKATLIYAQLLKMYPRNGMYWAGLAVSMEAEGSKRQAFSAYQKASEFGGLKLALSTYVQEKIHSLETN